MSMKYCLAQLAQTMINAPSLAPPSLWRKGASRGLAMGNAEMTTFPVMGTLPTYASAMPILTVMGLFRFVKRIALRSVPRC